MNTNKRLYFIIFLSCILLILFTSCSSKNGISAPLAPTLGLPTSTLPMTLGETSTEKTPTFPPVSSDETLVPTDAAEAHAIPTNTPVSIAATATPAAEKNCGQSGSMTILFIGSNISSGVKPYGADAIRVIQINFDAQTLKAITFPRDMLIKTASQIDEKQVEQPIGITYFEAYEAVQGTQVDKNAIGARVLAQLIQGNFGVRPDYYMTLQIDKLIEIIDTIGGVEINIPVEITTENGIYFPAGVQTLDGIHAAEYIRFLYPGGETARTARQNQLLAALQSKFFTVEVLSQIPTLISQNTFLTDLSVEQIASIVCISEKIPKENITFDSIDKPELITDNVPDVEAIKTYLGEMLK